MIQPDPTNNEIATHGSYTLIAGFDGNIHLRDATGAILLNDWGIPLTFGSVASAVAWCRA